MAPVCSTVGLLDEAAVRVDAGAVVLLLGLLLAEPQDVLQAVQGHLDDLGVHHRQQIAQGLDAAQVHQVSARTTARRDGSLAAVSEALSNFIGVLTESPTRHPTAAWESNLICSGVPPDVAFVMAQAASFLVLNSAFCRISMRTGKMLASITV